MALTLESLIPVLSAIVIACIGYWKNRPEEEFSQTKFIRTIIIGIVVGVVQVALNLTPVTASDWATLFLVNTGIIDIIVKILEGLGNRAKEGTLIQRTLG